MFLRAHHHLLPPRVGHVLEEGTRNSHGLLSQILQVQDIPYTLNGKRVEVPVKKASPKGIFLFSVTYSLLLAHISARKRRVYLPSRIPSLASEWCADHECEPSDSAESGVPGRVCEVRGAAPGGGFMKMK